MLGRLAVRKIAQPLSMEQLVQQHQAQQRAAPSFNVFEMMRRQQQRQQQAQQQLTGSLSYQQSMPPATSGAQVGLSALQQAVGDIGLAAAPLIPLVAPYIKKYTGFDIGQLYRTGYGGSDFAADQAQRVGQALNQQYISNNAEMIERYADSAGRIIGGLPVLAKSFLASVGFTPNSVGDWIRNNRDAVGTFWSTFAQVMPGLHGALTSMDPNYFDSTPLVHIAMQSNEGRMTPEVQAQAAQMRNELVQDLQSGQYGRLPGNQVVNAMLYAHQQLGAGATDDKQLVANLASAAETANQTGLASDSPSALRLIGDMYGTAAVARDPEKAMRDMKGLQDMITRGGVSREQVLQGVQLAKQRGMDPRMGAYLVAQSGLFGNQYGQEAGQRISGQATDAFAQLHNKPELQALGAAVRTGYSNYADELRKDLQIGSVRGLMDLGRRAMADRGLLRQFGGDPRKILGKGYGSDILGQAGHRMAQGLMLSEAQKALRDVPRPLRKRLNRAFAGHRREKVLRAMATGNYDQARVRPDVAAWLESNPSIASTIMATDPDLTQYRRVAPVRLIPSRKLPEQKAKPVPRLGLPHSSEAKKPAVPGSK